MPDTAAAFAPGATVAAVARQYDVAIRPIYKGRRTVRARQTCFAEVVVVPGEVLAASPAVIHLEVAGKVRRRFGVTTTNRQIAPLASSVFSFTDI